MERFEITNSKKTIIDSIVMDNKDYIKDNGGNVASYLILNFEADENDWREYCSDEQQELVDSMSIAERNEYFKDILRFINLEYDYEVN